MDGDSDYRIDRHRYLWRDRREAGETPQEKGREEGEKKGLKERKLTQCREGLPPGSGAAGAPTYHGLRGQDGFCKCLMEISPWPTRHKS